MTHRRIRAAAVFAVAVVALTACTSSAKHHTSSSNTPTDPAALSARIKSAVAGLSSASIKVSINLSAEALTGTGTEKLSAGNLSALDMTIDLAGAGKARVIVAGGKTYVQLPAALNPSGKPWLLVTSSSSNATVRQVAPLLDPLLSAVTPATFSQLVAAAKSIDVKGNALVGGVRTTHYLINVDVAKLPESFPGKAALAAGGATAPFDLYLDAKDQPLRATPHLSVQGQDVPIDVEYSHFNAPVSITAPPADRVGS